MTTIEKTTTNLQLSADEPTIVRTENNIYVVVKEHDRIEDNNPRTDWDGNLGHMVCWHKRYNLGDEHNFEEPHDLLVNLASDVISVDEDDAEEMSSSELKQMLEDSGEIILLPLYLMDHSGLSMSTTDFNDRWDSGQVGWIYALKNEAYELWGRIDDDWEDQARKELENEVVTYDQMLRGEIYGASVYLYMGDEPFDSIYTGGQPYEYGNLFECESCWGFYGDDDEASGLADYVREQVAD